MFNCVELGGVGVRWGAVGMGISGRQWGGSVVGWLHGWECGKGWRVSGKGVSLGATSSYLPFLCSIKNERSYFTPGYGGIAEGRYNDDARICCRQHVRPGR